jgi:hypothetical protein
MNRPTMAMGRSSAAAIQNRSMGLVAGRVAAKIGTA